MSIVAITGHRPNKLGYEYDHSGPISTAIRAELEEICGHYDVTECISGMALGVDTIWAQVALHMEIPLTCAIPFDGQERAWPAESQHTYRKILAKASRVHVVCEGGYAAWKMQKRNEWMVNNCDYLIAVWDGTSGGTANCVAYAEKVGRRINRIDPKLLVGNTKHMRK